MTAWRAVLLGVCLGCLLLTAGCLMSRDEKDMERAHSLIETNMYQGANKMLQRIIDRNESQHWVAEAYLLRLELQEKSSLYAAMLRTAAAGVALGQNRTAFLYYRGEAHRQLFQWDAAVEGLQAFTAVEPANATGQTVLAYALLAVGETQAALEGANAAVAADTAAPGGFLVRSVVYGVLGEAEQAEADYQQSARVRHAELKAWQWDRSLRIHLYRGEFQEAAQVLESRLATMPTTPRTQRDRAEALLWSAVVAAALGDGEGFEAAYKKARAARPWGQFPEASDVLAFGQRVAARL